MVMRLSGLSSGMDTEAVVKQLMQIERQPLIQFQKKAALLQARKTDMSSVKSSLYTLQSKIADLTYASVFKARKAISTDEKVVTATAQNGTAASSYVVNVTNMATATRNTGAALSALPGGFSSGSKATMVSTAELDTTVGQNANPTAAFQAGMGATQLESNVTAGSFYINNVEIRVVGTDTVTTVLDKITNSAAGVTASLAGDKITLTQKSVGSTPTITLGATDTSGFLAAAKLAGATPTAGVDADENRALKDTALNGVLASGYFSINGTFISVDKNTDTLTSVISKINSSSAGVTAFYDPTSQKISVASKTTGATAINLGTTTPPGTDTSNFWDAIGMIQGNEVQGSNTAVTVNGVAVTPVNNNVSLNGVNFTIKGTGTSTVTVQNDLDSMVAKVKAFVDQYNSTIDLVNGELTEQTVKDAKTTDDLVKGNLRGDSLLTSIQTKLRSFVYTPVTSQPSSLELMSQVGLSTGAVGSSVASAKTGHLVLDETKLRSALETNPDLVASFFGNGAASSTGEAVGTGNGSQTVFNLGHTPVATVPQPQVKVGTTVYTLVAGAPSSAPGSTEYSINYTTGQITFGEAPTAAAGAITATYDYNITSGSDAGIALQMKTYLGELTKAGGSFDNRIGTNGSLTKQIAANQKYMADFEARMQLREKALYAKFTAMETQLNALKSQGNWLTSQLASLSGSGSS